VCFVILVAVVAVVVAVAFEFVATVVVRNSSFFDGMVFVRV